MTSSFRGAFSSKKNTDETHRLLNVRVVAIQSIAKPVLATLAATLLSSDDASLYTGSRPAMGHHNHLSYDDARRQWFDREHNKLSIAEQDDPSQVGAFIESSGVDVDHSEIVFIFDEETRFERNAQSMRIRAECLVEYDANEQTNAIMSSSATAGGGDSYAFDDYDCLRGDDELPSSKQPKSVVAPITKKPKMEQLLISGTWPALSPCVRLDLVVKSSSNGKHDAVEIVPHFDDTYFDTPRITIGNFVSMLRHGAILHPQQIDVVLGHLFPMFYVSNTLAVGAPCACFQTVAAPDDADANTHPYAYSVGVGELLRAIGQSSVISLERVFSHNSVFAGLAPMLLFPRAIAAFVECYGPRRWIDIVARGPALITRLYEMMRTCPHVLCFTQLKYDECVRVQKEIIERAKFTPPSTIATAPTTYDAVNEIMRRRDAEVAAMRWLAQMPELTMRDYATLTRQNSGTITMSFAQRAIVRVAIDIYASIIRHDLFSGASMFDDQRRNEANGRGATSGHVFSVFGNSYGQQVPSERYDSGYSDGTLSLDTFFNAWAAEERQKKLAAERAAAKPVAAIDKSIGVKRKAPPSNEIEDFLPAKLPTIRPPVLQQSASPPPPPPSVAPSSQSRAPIAPPEALNEDISRLTELCTNYQFYMALRWLCEESLLVTFTSIGTGPRNAGRPFDLFYTRDMWRTQVALCETLNDIYERALIDRLTPRPVGAASQHTIAKLNADLAFREQARCYLRSIVRREENRQAEMSDLRALIRSKPKADELKKAEERLASMSTGRLPVAQLVELHRVVIEMTDSMGDATPPSPPDAYSDMLAFGAHRLARDDDAAIEARLAATVLSDEQKDGIRHVLHNGLTIFMSPGGCGKTFAVKCITQCFSLDQIVVCALTGKACEVLQKQIGKVSTIHSLLLRETLHRQALKRHRERIARLRAMHESTRLAADTDANRDSRKFLEIQADLESLIGFADSRSPLANVRLLIIDETSLTDEALVRRLFEFLHPMNATARGDAALMRVLFLGDFNQLGSIEPGSLLQSLCRAFPHCVRTFTHNFRSAGASIFKLARGIVLRKPAVLDVDFDTRRNEARLRRSTVPANESPAEVAAADDASVVFYTTNDRSLQSDLRRVLGLLGAVTPRVVDADLLALRDGIHVIVPTNALASTCNTYCREMYFGRPVSSPIEGAVERYELPTPVLYFKAMRADRIYFRRNFKTVVEVSADAIEQEAIYESAQLSGESRRRAALLAIVATADAQNVDAGVDEDETPQAVVTEHGRLAIELLDRCMSALGATLGDGKSRRFVTRFFNSEILTLCDLYNVPRRRDPHVMCVCGLCPTPPPPRTIEEAKARQRTPSVPSSCVLWPHVVPQQRRRIGDLSSTASIVFHDQNLTTSNSAHTRRMAVFRTQTGAYKQLAVESDMSERAAWEYGFATTIHRYQGSGTKTIIIVIPRDTTFVDRSMLYTAVTRAEQRVIFMGSADTWRRVAQREPPLRRTELWFMLAQTIAKSHQRVADVCGCRSADGTALAAALQARSDTEREFLNTNRRPLPADSGVVWAYFDRMYAEMMQRAGLAEL